ncbi:hypothetical protein JKA74_15420 [Marivirga sp. S37H4]|uniref:Lipoprotein n=1 Tax=Marivirga aurantiaca TaxID=2802615 RepID=A0A934X0J0_9BACT|nr:hypothetical protein [Marivirga aurantiaca]MBK6266434.1 hypothetical protein [Marivirga aurantiaca]
MPIRFFLYFILLFMLTACNLDEKIKDVTTFNITNNVNFSIPSSAVVDLPVDLNTPDVSSSSQQSFENNNTRADLVENANLKELTLTITSPEARTFKFLRSVKIYISNDTKGETLLAEKNEIPTDIGSILELETTGANLDEYIKESTYDLRYDVVIRESVNSTTEINAKMVFEVRAKIL